MGLQPIAIHGLGAIAPVTRSPGSFADACQQFGQFGNETADVPPPEGMTARDQRRLARLTRLAMYAADCAAAQAGVKGRDAGIYVGLTHGTADYLKEFHDYLFDFGPEMASPNAFSNGVTNAPLGSTSLHQKLTQGGATIVGIETGGLEVLHHVTSKLHDGTHELCYVGATEEYSPIVADVYHRVGWYGGTPPGALPHPYTEDEMRGFGVSEGSVFAVASRLPEGAQDHPVCLYEPVEELARLDTLPDLIVSGAGGGPQDGFELEALEAVLSLGDAPVPVLFSKPFFGETFAVGPLLSLAIAWDVLVNQASYPMFAPHASIASRVAGAFAPSEVRSALVLAANREGLVLGGILRRA